MSEKVKDLELMIKKAEERKDNTERWTVRKTKYRQTGKKRKKRKGV